MRAGLTSSSVSSQEEGCEGLCFGSTVTTIVPFVLNPNVITERFMTPSPKHSAPPRIKTLATCFGLLVVLAMTGCATHERVVVRETVVVQPVIRHMPAPVREERGAAPGVGWNWVPGHWKWEGRDWAWVHGKWVPDPVPPMPALVVETVSPPPSPSHFWVPGHWVWRYEGSAWIWVPGRWMR